MNLGYANLESFEQKFVDGKSLVQTFHHVNSAKMQLGNVSHVEASMKLESMMFSKSFYLAICR